jgi:hypothetical protein
VRFLLLLRRGRFRSFKRVRIGLKLLKQGITTVLFNHQKYAWFCLGIAGIQFIRMYATTFIDAHFSLTTAITESLMGRNFFDILLDRISTVKIPLLLAESLFFYLEQWGTFALASAVSYYTLIPPSTLAQSVYVSFTKWKPLALWALLNCIILFITALLGSIGDILEFVWSLSTALVIPLITFKPYSVATLVKDGFKAFKKRMSLFIGADVSLELILTLLTLLFYALYSKQATPSFQFLQPEHFSVITLSAFSYLNAVVTITEATTLALVYQALMIPEHKEFLKQQ